LGFWYLCLRFEERIQPNLITMLWQPLCRASLAVLVWGCGYFMDKIVKAFCRMSMVMDDKSYCLVV
jgi:hypothetical protein